MPSVLQEISAAVVTSLNAATLSQSFTATRTWDAIFESKPTSWEVTVIPAGMGAEVFSRDRKGSSTYGILVAVRKTMQPNDNTELDAGVLLVEEIVDHLRGAGNMAGAIFAGVELEPMLDSDILRESHVFSAGPVFSYRKLRD